MVQNVYDLRPLWADFHIVISTWLGTHELSSNSKYVESISAKMLFAVLWNRWSIANKQQYSISFEICTYLFFWNLSVFFVWRITWDKHIQVQLKVVSRYQYWLEIHSILRKITIKIDLKSLTPTRTQDRNCAYLVTFLSL